MSYNIRFSHVTFYSKPAIHDGLYGESPVSWKLFFRIRPSKMEMTSHGSHGQMSGADDTTSKKN